jgi:hypothetical protein
MVPLVDQVFGHLMDALVDQLVGTLCLALADQLLDQLTDQYVVVS